jgi:hypothetical protein
MSSIILQYFINDFLSNFAAISPNVKVVYDVFAVAMEKLQSSFSNRKNVVEKNRTKGVARLRFFGTRAALAAKHIQSCYVKWGRTPIIQFELSSKVLYFLIYYILL